MAGTKDRSQVTGGRSRKIQKTTQCESKSDNKHNMNLTRSQSVCARVTTCDLCFVPAGLNDNLITSIARSVISSS